MFIPDGGVQAVTRGQEKLCVLELKKLPNLSDLGMAAVRSPDLWKVEIKRCPRISCDGMFSDLSQRKSDSVCFNFNLFCYCCVLIMVVFVLTLKKSYHRQFSYVLSNCLVKNSIKAVLNWAEHSVREQLCLLEMFKLTVRFLIDVFDLGEQLCSRPMGRRSDVRNVPSARYGSMLLIGWTLSWRRRRNKKEARL